jgi:glycosyltransferase involved in cell wall biosynthesis
MTAKPRAPLVEKALWRVRNVILPKPLRGAEAASVKVPLVVAGFFRTASGVGQSARACAAALERHGRNPVCVDLSKTFNQVDIDAGRVLSAMPDDEAGILILHVNAPETERALFKLRLFRPRRWRIIGVWAWELGVAPQSWFPVARRLSEIWTLSGFVAAAFRDKAPAPVKVVAPFVAAPESINVDRARLGAAESDVVCLAMADGRSSFARKNLLAALRIFGAAAGANPNVRLIVKTRNVDEFPRFAEELRAAASHDARVVHLDGALSESERWSLLAGADIFLSPHRSEGFGLALAEAMALGKTVLATGWSGNLDFMTRENAALIPFALVPVPDDVAVYGGVDRGALWAEPDEHAAADLLRGLLEQPARRAAIGAEARRTVRGLLDGRRYLEALG